MIEELGRFVAEATNLRNAGHHDAALLTILRAQERLFVRPAPDFTARTPEDQIRLLTVGEPAENAALKCLAYAGLIVEAGLVYRDREQPALALGAGRFAVEIIHLTARGFPQVDLAPIRARVAALLASLPDGELKSAIVAELNRPDEPARPTRPADDSAPPPSQSP